MSARGAQIRGARSSGRNKVSTEAPNVCGPSDQQFGAYNFKVAAGLFENSRTTCVR